MHGTAFRPIAGTSAARPGGEPAADILIALRGPVEMVLTRALQSLARRHPAAFERLGVHRASTYRLAPTDFPVAFQLRPHPHRGTIRVVRRGAPAACVAQVSGSLADLLALFDGSLDADAAFFARSIQVEGDIGAVMALHNALESADLRLADLLPLPAGRDAANRILDRLARMARRRAAGAGA